MILCIRCLSFKLQQHSFYSEPSAELCEAAISTDSPVARDDQHDGTHAAGGAHGARCVRYAGAPCKLA